MQTINSSKNPTSLLCSDYQLRSRNFLSTLFVYFCSAVAASVVCMLFAIVALIAWMGWNSLSFEFLISYPSRFASMAGIRSALLGSAYLISVTILIALPVGVGAAVFLEELMPRNMWRRFIDANIDNLAHVPSVVYGVIGLAVFVRLLNFDRSILSGALTLSMLMLPVVVISTREALRTVPSSLRNASLALGATRWQTTYAHVLPTAMPNIMTGLILAVSRGMGESAPLILVGATSFIAYDPSSVFDGFTVLPIQIFNWAQRPQIAFHELAAAGILVLLALLLVTNAFAIVWRNRIQANSLWKQL